MPYSPRRDEETEYSRNTSTRETSSQSRPRHHHRTATRTATTSSNMAGSVSNPNMYTMPLPSQGRVGAPSSHPQQSTGHARHHSGGASSSTSRDQTTKQASWSTTSRDQTTKPASSSGMSKGKGKASLSHQCGESSTSESTSAQPLPTLGDDRPVLEDSSRGQLSNPRPSGTVTSPCGCPITVEEENRRREARRFADNLRNSAGERDLGFERLITGFWPRVPGRPWAFDGIVDPGDDIYKL